MWDSARPRAISCLFRLEIPLFPPNTLPLVWLRESVCLCVCVSNTVTQPVMTDWATCLLLTHTQTHTNTWLPHLTFLRPSHLNYVGYASTEEHRGACIRTPPYLTSLFVCQLITGSGVTSPVMSVFGAPFFLFVHCLKGKWRDLSYFFGFIC